MRATGDYATFEGREFRVVARGSERDGRDYVGLLLDEHDDGAAFDDVVERSAGDRMARVSRHQLERLERVTTTGILDGEELIVHGLGEIVPCSFVGDPAWAAAHGFDGSQHDGWSGEVLRSEIIDIHETVADLLRPAAAGGGR